MIAVNLKQLSKKYGRRIGISGIDLTVNEGEIFGLIGPDGAGKSTILRILMNFINPSDGDAEVFDMDVVDETKAIKKDTVYVPAEVYFYNRLKASKYINLTMKAHHCKKDEHFKSIMQAFEVNPKVRFEDMDHSEQKKMALATAIAVEPRLLLLDEPLRGLDANIQNRLFDYLMDLQDNGTTILITGRDSEEIASICNRMAVIENGEITVTPEEFAYDHPDFREQPILPPDDEEELEEVSDLEKTIVITPAIEPEIPAEEIPEEVTAEEAASEEIPEEAEKEKEAETAPAEVVEEKQEEAPVEEVKPAKEYKNITMRSVGFKRDAFESIGAKIVSEENGKIIMEYSGDLNVLAKLLYDLNMDDIQLSSKDLQEVFMPFYEGGEDK
ncbi:MAG: ATP-binding cassette domain-containing protein [Firmicutes bacterium]|nr:ATP-binding cassette domain-containing protein [Bacillota bacterium]